MPEKIGFVGVGRMGGNMARRLKEVGGYSVVAVYDARPEVARALANELGAEACTALARVTESVERARGALAGMSGNGHRTATTFGEVVDELEADGIVLRDLAQGLVDFPAEKDGEVVYLCWQFGEPEVAFWHRVEEGFAGRQPLPGNARARTLQ